MPLRAVIAQSIDVETRGSRVHGQNPWNNRISPLVHLALHRGDFCAPWWISGANLSKDGPDCWLAPLWSFYVRLLQVER